MKQYTKKIFSVLIAILVGTAIIFFSLKGTGATRTGGTESDASVNWKDSLSVVPQKYSLKALGAVENNITVESVVATTSTDLIARKLLLEYASIQNNSATTTISDRDVAGIAGVLANDVKLPNRKIFTIADLHVSTASSTEANLSYANKVNQLIRDFLPIEQPENEITILASAVSTKDSIALSKISSKATLYQNLINKLLMVDTPPSLSTIHLRLISACETLRAATVGLQSILVDPVIGVASITLYQSGIDEIISVKQDYRNFFSNY